MHDGRGRFKCDFEGCQESFETNKLREKHKENDHKDDKYKYYCEKCLKGFNRERGLKDHLETNHDILSGEYKVCHICGFNAKSNLGLSSHMKTHSEEISDDVTFHFDPDEEFEDVRGDLRRVSKVWEYFLFNKTTEFSKCRICGFTSRCINKKGHSGKFFYQMVIF